MNPYDQFRLAMSSIIINGLNHDRRSIRDAIDPRCKTIKRIGPRPPGQATEEQQSVKPPKRGKLSRKQRKSQK